MRAGRLMGAGGRLKVLAASAGAAMVIGGMAKTPHRHHHPAAAHLTAAVPGAARAIAFARDQLGKPYCWGGNGASCPNPPYTGFDCSGLVTAAWAAAGVAIPRTTFTEWSALPHIPASQARPGDLVLAPGSDGTPASPGHVGMLLPGGRVIQAYGQGVPVSIVTLAAFAAGAGGITGYVRPGGTP